MTPSNQKLKTIDKSMDEEEIMFDDEFERNKQDETRTGKRLYSKVIPAETMIENDEDIDKFGISPDDSFKMAVTQIEQQLKIKKENSITNHSGILIQKAMK